MELSVSHAEAIVIRTQLIGYIASREKHFPRDRAFYDTIPGKGNEAEFFAFITQMHDQIDTARSVLAKIDAAIDVEGGRSPPTCAIRGHADACGETTL